MDWRAGQQKIEDFNTKQEPNKLDELRDEVQKLASDILLKKYKLKKTADNMTRSINNAKDEDTLVTLSLRIKTIDTLCIAFNSKKVDQDNYKIILTKILIAQNGELDTILKDLHKVNPEDQDNKDLLEHYRNTIDQQHEELGYDPKHALNSMQKHLGCDDHYTVTDWEKLKQYSDYLTEEIKNPKPKKEEVKAEKLEPESKEIDPQSDTPFGEDIPKEKNKPLADPNYKDTMKEETQEEIDIG